MTEYSIVNYILNDCYKKKISKVIFFAGQLPKQFAITLKYQINKTHMQSVLKSLLSKFFEVEDVCFVAWGGGGISAIS